MFCPWAGVTGHCIWSWCQPWPRSNWFWAWSSNRTEAYMLALVWPKLCLCVFTRHFLMPIRTSLSCGLTKGVDMQGRRQVSWELGEASCSALCVSFPIPRAQASFQLLAVLPHGKAPVEQAELSARSGAPQDHRGAPQGSHSARGFRSPQSWPQRERFVRAISVGSPDNQRTKYCED